MYWTGCSGRAAHSIGRPWARAQPQLPKSGLYGPMTKPERTAAVRSPKVAVSNDSQRTFDGP
ncbi:hypothetical protein [Kribbella shirazensis]|uniref:Uncharacterized protein n=1 Tax=Kribbella shirazensis TaxID=1105143 RepID=A0A7X6A0G4_9ACTN|nr:hypothetical protein [Kribbella shirazensis]NIK57167.1 hypothetical protein [Kribbella shirazensis]